MLQVYFPSRGWMCIDATDPMKGNWLRYVNWARSSKEQNLFPLEINRAIYYKVLKVSDTHMSGWLIWKGGHICLIYECNRRFHYAKLIHYKLIKKLLWICRLCWFPQVLKLVSDTFKKKRKNIFIIKIDSLFNSLFVLVTEQSSYCSLFLKLLNYLITI